MPTASPVLGFVLKNHTGTFMARVVGADGSAVQQADIDSIDYTVWLLDEDCPDTMTVIEGHEDVELVVADTIFDALQTDAIWTVDDTGYNFKHEINVLTNGAFGIAGRRYRAEFHLTPSSGQVIAVRFDVNCI